MFAAACQSKATAPINTERHNSRAEEIVCRDITVAADVALLRGDARH